jgi:predicted transposase/invertase (TIGR01784 family)
MPTTTDRFINPFTDFGFKRIFGEEPNADILIDFLNTIFRGEVVIKELSLKSPFKQGKTQEERKAVFDLYCVTNKDERIIIEMQKAKQKYFKDRSVFYSTFPIQEQAQSGEWDYKLSAVYTVGILDFVFDDENKEKPIVQEIKLIDTKTQRVFYDKLAFVYLQMPNFTKEEHELEDRFDQWMYFLKNMPRFQDYPNLMNDRIFKKLFKISEIANLNKEEAQAYEESLKVFRDLKNTIDTAYDEGKIEGIMEGEQIGLQKGEQIGLQKGKIEREIEIATEMIKNGESNEKIMRYTELNDNEINEIRKI